MKRNIFNEELLKYVISEYNNWVPIDRIADAIWSYHRSVKNNIEWYWIKTENRYRKTAWNKWKPRTWVCPWDFKKWQDPWNKWKKTWHIPWNKWKEHEMVKWELNVNWKWWVTEINQKIRHSLEYKEWRKSVFERDNYTCVNCNERSWKWNPVYIEADHIKPFCEFPELRFDLSNGRTLCKECHKKIWWRLFKDRNPRKKVNNNL